eukprot:1157877-Pelagomonas_calceolata.AAC.1
MYFTARGPGATILLANCNLQRRSADPNFRPVSMLDFGAGFGGATQAAQQLTNVSRAETGSSLASDHGLALHVAHNHMAQHHGAA